ncbi:MAG: NADase-type glycan-binding domain-containing protein, partial [Labedaea sp.]
ASGPPALPKPSDGEAKELIVPVTGSALAKPQPDALEPQEPQKRVATVRRQPPSRRLKPGDLICGECGEGNAETRKFCSRCGTSLNEAEQVKMPWWRRLLPKRGAKVRKSGDRPKRRGRGGKSGLGLAASSTFKVIRRVVTMALLVGGILYAVFAPFRGWVNQQFTSVKHQVEVLIFPQYAPVSPTKGDFKCPAQLPPDHGCDKAVDGFSNTNWLAPVNGQQPVIVLNFGRSVDLSRAIIRNGANDDFQANHRARKLHLVFNTGKTSDIDLLDNPDPNQYDIHNGEGASSVEIHVVDLFQSVQGPNLAITEIELFEKK